MDETLPGTPFEQFLRHSIDSDDSFMEESQVVADFSEEVLKDISLLPTSDSAMCQLAEKVNKIKDALKEGKAKCAAKDAECASMEGEDSSDEKNEAARDQKASRDEVARNEVALDEAKKQLQQLLMNRWLAHAVQAKAEAQSSQEHRVDPSIRGAGNEENGTNVKDSRSVATVATSFMDLQALATSINTKQTGPSETVCMTPVSALMIQSGKVQGSNNVFEGVVLNVKEAECKIVDRQANESTQDSPKRRRVDDGPVETMDLVMADYTGVVLVNLWASVATEARNLLDDGKEGKEAISLRIAKFAVKRVPENNWNGEVLTPMHTVVSVNFRKTSSAEETMSESTQIMKIDEHTSEFLQCPPFQVPSKPLTISHFPKAFKERKPIGNFRASFVGVVCDVQTMDCSQSGVPKQSFKLVDGDGNWLNCCAHGYHAGGPGLQRGMYVYLFGGSGRGAIGSDDAAVRVLKDGFVYPLKQKTVFQGPKTQVKL